MKYIKKLAIAFIVLFIGFCMLGENGFFDSSKETDSKNVTKVNLLEEKDKKGFFWNWFSDEKENIKEKANEVKDTAKQNIDDLFRNNNNDKPNNYNIDLNKIPNFDNKTPYLFVDEEKYIKPDKIDYSNFGKQDSSVTSKDLNNGTPFFTNEDIKKAKNNVWENYSELDSLGRCGVAYANICKELMPTEERGEIGSIKPSGWQTIKYNGIVEGNYLYNRCHLIGFQLAGENANKKNLITGTRYLNIQGMVRYENMIASYIRRTNNHCLYRVTPVYKGDNLLCDGLLIEGYSVEDSGKGINFCIYSYNEQPDIVIDHKTGESKLK